MYVLRKYVCAVYCNAVQIIVCRPHHEDGMRTYFRPSTLTHQSRSYRSVLASTCERFGEGFTLNILSRAAPHHIYNSSSSEREVVGLPPDLTVSNTTITNSTTINTTNSTTILLLLVLLLLLHTMWMIVTSDQPRPINEPGNINILMGSGLLRRADIPRGVPEGRRPP